MREDSLGTCFHFGRDEGRYLHMLACSLIGC